MGFKLSVHVCGLATQQRRGRQVAEALKALSPSLLHDAMSPAALCECVPLLSAYSPLRAPVDDAFL
jgi:hypothetical protein